MTDKNKISMKNEDEEIEEGVDFWGEENDEKKVTAVDDNAVVPKSKIILIKKLIQNIKENSEQLNNLLAPFIKAEDEDRISLGQLADEDFKKDEDEEGRVVEGVFDGESMVGPDGKIYSVPANYASKSKLVEGDIMKLTITANGTFVYKQIGPIDRNRVVGRLEKSPEGNFSVSADGKKWRILTASVTYFKGQSGDEAVILVPKAGDSKWAAVENIIRSKE